MYMTVPELKGTYIVSNHYSIHMDEEYWLDPQVFRPDRFINENGDFVADKRVCQFGFGKDLKYKINSFYRKS
jgi:cytochrome P450